MENRKPQSYPLDLDGLFPFEVSVCQFALTLRRSGAAAAVVVLARTFASAARICRPARNCHLNEKRFVCRFDVVGRAASKHAQFWRIK